MNADGFQYDSRLPFQLPSKEKENWTLGDNQVNSSVVNKTALLRVHHDLASALDNDHSVVLVMLDPSAAFDVIDHDIHFNRLQH
jgi:hypothetical protein